MIDVPPRRVSDRKGVIERHTQTVLVTIAIGLTTWVGTSIIELQRTMAVSGASRESDSALVLVKLESLKEQIKFITDSSYTRTQAQADLLLRDQRDIDLERRVKSLEDKK